MATGVVREWNADQGWGVLNSDETPGGCWVHCSALSMAGDHRALPGQRVIFTYRPATQDGFDFQALDVTIEGVPRAETDIQPPGPGYHDRLTIELD